MPKPAIETFFIDHFIQFELQGLCRIRSKKVEVSRVNGRDLLEVLKMKEGGFEKLEVLEIANFWPKVTPELWEELVLVCGERQVQIIDSREPKPDVHGDTDLEGETASE